MSFRKRSVVVGGSSSPLAESQSWQTHQTSQISGVRPSPLDGRLTTSSGTHSLDSLLAGHSGLALGISLLVEESGTTDFGGSFLRHYAAEGIVQGHHVHVFGVNEAWGRDLPGLADYNASSEPEAKKSEERMKIAWRYEKLGEFGAGSRDRNVSHPAEDGKNAAAIFCHDFDLSKRLTLPSQSLLHYCAPQRMRPSLDPLISDKMTSPFKLYLKHLMGYLSNSPKGSIHRVIIPSILSPALYQSDASRPNHILQFFHALRALLRRYSTQMTAIITLPLTLYPRSTGLTRWMELLSDGVLELAPFPSAAIVPKSSSSTQSTEEEAPQGMLKIHRLPIFHEKGGGGGGAGRFGDNFAFTLSRRKGLVIKPYSLPPVEGDTEAQQAGLVRDGGKEASKLDLEF